MVLQVSGQAHSGGLGLGVVLGPPKCQGLDGLEKVALFLVSILWKRGA